MIKYNSELRKDKVSQDGLMPIRILFRIDSSIIKRNTGLSCKINDWQNNRVKANSKKDTYYGYDEINEILQQIETKIQDISLYFRAISLNKQRICLLKSLIQMKKLKYLVNTIFSNALQNTSTKEN